MQFDIVANDKATATMGNVEKSMQKFSKNIGSSLTMAVGRVTAVLATVQKVTQVISEAGDIADQAARLGLSVEVYQKLKFAAEDYGSSVEEIAKAMKDVNKLLDAAATKKAGPEMDTLKALGFSDADILNRNVKQAEVWERIGEAIKGATSEEEKFAVASRVFGDKISTSLVPILENYGQFNTLMASTATIGQKSAENLDKLGTKLSQFGQFVKALGTEAAGRVAGLLVEPDTKAPPQTAAQKATSATMAANLLKIGAKTSETAKTGAGEVSSMAAVGAASFRGFPTPIAKPIEEQQLVQLEKIASNTSPDTAPKAPPVGGTDMSKVNTIEADADAIRRTTGKTMMERFIRPAR